jgi:GT2 family glycosyltransferase
VNEDNTPLVSIILLTYNSMVHIKTCLDSIRKLHYPNVEVILVDNASSDGSADYVEHNYSSVKVIRNKENMGFAYGNNLGATVASGRYILFLNIDTEATPYSVNNLVQIAESDNTIGICGCKLLFFNRRDLLQSAGGRYSLLGIPWDRGTYEKDQGQFDKIEEVSFVCGAALLIRKNLISQIGSFDSVFFAYNEDVDLCLRSWVCGFRVMYVPSAIVYHKLQWNSDRRFNPRFVFHQHKNTLLILVKNFKMQTIIKWLPLSLSYETFWFVSFVARQQVSSAWAIVRSLGWIMRNSSYIIRERQRIMHKRLKPVSNLKKYCSPAQDAFQEFRRRSLLSPGGKTKLK